MKKVKASDLRDLIWDQYLHIVYHVPILECCNETCYSIRIDVNSVCINIYDTNTYESDDDQKVFLQKFANRIEELTSGKLKAIEIGCEKKNASYLRWLHIAVEYDEVV